jgi:hypothetical protein
MNEQKFGSSISPALTFCPYVCSFPANDSRSQPGVVTFNCSDPARFVHPLPITRCVRVWLGVMNSCTSSKIAVLGLMPSLTPLTAGTLNARDGVAST